MANRAGRDPENSTLEPRKAGLAESRQITYRVDNTKKVLTCSVDGGTGNRPSQALGK